MVSKRSIELEQDEVFERREWKIQRVGWIFMIAIMLAGLLGLTGSGPLSSRTANSLNGEIRIEYNKFLHYNTPEKIQIYLTVPENGGDAILIAERSFVKDMDLKEIVPEPESQVVGKDFMLYRFNSPHKEVPLLISLEVRPGIYGNRNFVFRTQTDEVVISQFIYP